MPHMPGTSRGNATFLSFPGLFQPSALCIQGGIAVGCPIRNVPGDASPPLAPLHPWHGWALRWSQVAAAFPFRTPESQPIPWILERRCFFLVFYLVWKCFAQESTPGAASYSVSSKFSSPRLGKEEALLAAEFPPPQGLGNA